MEEGKVVRCILVCMRGLYVVNKPVNKEFIFALVIVTENANSHLLFSSQLFAFMK
jgi:hypothetical protein